MLARRQHTFTCNYIATHYTFAIRVIHNLLFPIIKKGYLWYAQSTSQYACGNTSGQESLDSAHGCFKVLIGRWHLEKSRVGSRVSCGFSCSIQKLYSLLK